MEKDKGGIAKAAAILEVLGIFVAGQLIIYVFLRLLGIELRNPLTSIRPDITPAELRPITLQLTWLLLAQYAGWFVLILPIGWAPGDLAGSRISPRRWRQTAISGCVTRLLRCSGFRTTSLRLPEIRTGSRCLVSPPVVSVSPR